MPHTTIGTRPVIYSDTLLIPDGESARFQLELSTELNMPSRAPEIVIKTDHAKQGDEGRIDWKSSGNVIEMTFANVPSWPASTPGFSEMGLIDGKKLYFSAFFQRVGTLTSLTIAFAVDA
jgi:hypothetical protein